MPEPITVRSFAKINLGLRIGPPRPDGFHHLTTLYQTIALHDEVRVEAELAPAASVTLTSNDPRLPLDGRNTVHRMVTAALEAMQVKARVHVHLIKNLPVQGGLGAGSSNAAAALLGLLRQLGPTAALTGEQRLLLAERIGSDVPLFLIGGAVYGHDRGQLVQPFPDLPAIPCVIVAPGVGSSTPQAFRAWDQRVATMATTEAQGRLDYLSRLYASAAVPAFSGTSGDSGITAATAGSSELLTALANSDTGNDFESVVFEQHPFLRDIRGALAGDDALPTEQRASLAALSGSGSSLFGLYQTMQAAEAARQRTQALRGRAFITETLPRSAYWGSMFPQAAPTKSAAIQVTL